MNSAIKASIANVKRQGEVCKSRPKIDWGHVISFIETPNVKNQFTLSREET